MVPMKQKILAALLLVMMLSPAFAAITITWNTPSEGTSYNNLPSNAGNIDLNFTVADDNTAVRDLNVLLTYRPAYLNEDGNTTTIIADANLFDWNANPTASQECTGADWTSVTCKYIWDMPENVTMGDDEYLIDANVQDWTSGTGTDFDNADGNASLGIVINTHIAYADTVRALMANAGLILAGIVLITGLGAIVIFKLDPMKGAILTVAAAIAVAIGAMIIGVALATL